MARRIARRLLAARIVVGHDHAVGVRGGDAAHLGPLARIAIAAAAEQRDQAAAGVRPQRVERLAERIGGMGVVDEHLRALRMARDPLQAAPHAAQPLERPDRGRRIGAAGDHQAQGREHVHRLEITDQAEADPMRPAIEGEPEVLAQMVRDLSVQPQPLGPAAVIEHADPAAAAELGERRVFRLIGVEHGDTLGRQELAEQAALGGQVVGEALVIIEVVA